MSTRKKTRAVAFSGIVSALCVVLLYFGSMIEVLDYTVSALCGLLVSIVLTEFGEGASLGVWLSSSILALLFIPTKIAALLFVAFCGWYPTLKVLFEKLPNLFSTILKFAVFNASLVIIFFVTVKVFMIEGISPLIFAGLFLLSNFVFLLYDILLTRVTLIYIFRLRKKLTFLK